MKRKLMLVVAILALVSSASFAQLKYGGGLSVGTKAALDDNLETKMGFGINARVEYALNDKISIVPNFTFWFPSKNEFSMMGYTVKSTATIWQLNADGHYMFSGDEALNFYGLAGINLTSVTAKAEVSGVSGSDSQSEIGLNLGAGANFNKFFGELKYDTEMEQLAFTVGILF